MNGYRGGPGDGWTGGNRYKPRGDAGEAGDGDGGSDSEKFVSREKKQSSRFK